MKFESVLGKSNKDQLDQRFFFIDLIGKERFVYYFADFFVISVILRTDKLIQRG